LKVKIKKLNPEAIIPTYAHNEDAGMDFYTSEDSSVENLSTKIIKTGIAMEIPEGYFLDIRPRSGISGNHPNYIANAPGTIDSSYTGEIIIIVRNNSFNKKLIIPKHFKIAQGIILKKYHAEFEEVNELTNSERGDSGFGSTGDK